jgi:hypothetical protein
VDYLKITEKEGRVAIQSPPRNYPSFEYVKILVDSINAKLKSPTGQGIGFIHASSGMRDKAIVTLRLGCFDEEGLVIFQNPRKGVETKFANSYRPRYCSSTKTW